MKVLALKRWFSTVRVLSPRIPDMSLTEHPLRVYKR